MRCSAGASKVTVRNLWFNYIINSASGQQNKNKKQINLSVHNTKVSMQWNVHPQPKHERFRRRCRIYHFALSKPSVTFQTPKCFSAQRQRQRSAVWSVWSVVLGIKQLRTHTCTSVCSYVFGAQLKQRFNILGIFSTLFLRLGWEDGFCFCKDWKHLYQTRFCDVICTN